MLLNKKRGNVVDSKHKVNYTVKFTVYCKKNWHIIGKEVLLLKNMKSSEKFHEEK